LVKKVWLMSTLEETFLKQKSVAKLTSYFGQRQDPLTHWHLLGAHKAFIKNLKM